ncbi:MAG TPA: ATP-binding protein [Myxococcota bacterium]|nr:ATP-binding protein [Myxococcota bacterium]
MRRTGIGLKSLLAFYLLLLSSLLGAALVYTAVRLTRHGLVMERVDSQRKLLRQVPRLLDDAGAPGLVELNKRLPSTRSLTIFDQKDKLIGSSDPRITARELWGAFGSRTAGGGPADDWSVWERGGKRTLTITARFPSRGWKIVGSFPLEDIDAIAARIAYQLSLYAALLAAVMALMGWVLLNRVIVRPLARLLRNIDRLPEGDLLFWLAADNGSELGRLGSSLGSMARRIEDDKKRMKDKIAELAKLNNELQRAQQGLVRSEKLASVGQLAAGVAHEVGNPISAILGYVGMLRSEEIPAKEQADILARVEREIVRIDMIIRDLLAYSRPGRSEIAPALPSELSESALSLIRPQKKFKTVEFTLDVPPGLPPVLTDADLTRQVLVNLMLNALDACGEGGRVWLRAVVMGADDDGRLLWDGGPEEPAFFKLGDTHAIRPPAGGSGFRPVDKVVVFCVVDDGVGIEEENLLRIFDPFFTTKEPGRGTGLGLAICHSAISALGGEIWAYSRRGHGTQFAFYLPVA